jgi:hypothetical protein
MQAARCHGVMWPKYWSLASCAPSVLDRPCSTDHQNWPASAQLGAVPVCHTQSHAPAVHAHKLGHVALHPPATRLNNLPPTTQVTTLAAPQPARAGGTSLQLLPAPPQQLPGARVGIHGTAHTPHANLARTGHTTQHTLCTIMYTSTHTGANTYTYRHRYIR